MNNTLTCFIFTIGLTWFSFSAMAADAPSQKNNIAKTGQTTPEDLAGTRFEQRVEIRKKSQAHWRDPPTGSRASRLKARREQLEGEAAKQSNSGEITAPE